MLDVENVVSTTPTTASDTVVEASGARSPTLVAVRAPSKVTNTLPHTITTVSTPRNDLRDTVSMVQATLCELPPTATGSSPPVIARSSPLTTELPSLHQGRLDVQSLRRLAMIHRTHATRRWTYAIRFRRRQYTGRGQCGSTRTRSSRSRPRVQGPRRRATHG